MGHDSRARPGLRVRTPIGKVAPKRQLGAIIGVESQSKCKMIKQVYVIRKRADVSEKEFYDYWLHQHGPLVTRVAKAIGARRSTR